MRNRLRILPDMNSAPFTAFLLEKTSGAGYAILRKCLVSRSASTLNIPVKFQGQPEGYAWASALRQWRKDAAIASLDYTIGLRNFRVAFFPR